MIENEKEFRQIFTDPYRREGREEELRKEQEEMEGKNKKDEKEIIKEESEE